MKNANDHKIYSSIEVFLTVGTLQMDIYCVKSKNKIENVEKIQINIKKSKRLHGKSWLCKTQLSQLQVNSEYIYFGIL